MCLPKKATRLGTHLYDDLETRWELELFNFLLEEWRLFAHLDESVELWTARMHVSIPIWQKTMKSVKHTKSSLHGTLN